MNISHLNRGGYREYKHCLIWAGEPSKEVALTDVEIASILKSSNAWMLRNLYDWDCNETTNFWEIINDTPRKIEDLPSKTRNEIRRSLRDCDIRIISPVELVSSNGYHVYVKSFERYHDITVTIETREEWEASVQNSKHEYWGVFRKEDGLLIAWGKNSLLGDSVSYNTLKAIPEYMNKHYPYFGLLFEMNRYYLDINGFKYVSDGFRSVSEHSNIQPFLEKNFLFRRAYCKLTLHYKWWIKIAVNILYPFRKLIRNPKIVNILRFEAINRNEY